MGMIALSSGQPRVRDLTIVGRGVIEATIPAGDDGVVASVAHNLGYTPMLFMYLRDEAFNYQQIPAQLFFPTFITNYRCGANQNEVWVRIDNDDTYGVDITEKFYFFLMDNPLDVFDAL